MLKIKDSSGSEFLHDDAFNLNIIPVNVLAERIKYGFDDIVDIPFHRLSRQIKQCY